MLFFEGNFVPAGDNVIEFVGILNGELVAGGVPGGGKDKFFEGGEMLFLFFGLFGGVSVEHVVFGLILVFDVLI